jgi:LmbE family N-acetylglucosaminyl deacetylase
MTVGTVQFLHRGQVSAGERLHEFHASMESLGVGGTHVLSRDLDGKLYTAPQSGFVTKLDHIQDEFQPDEVLIPLPSSHQDHRYAWEVGIAATRPSAAKHRPNLIAAYEYPSTNWGDGASVNAGHGGMYVDISNYWQKKQQALSLYETQMRGKHHLYSCHAIEALATLRGLEAGYEKAELFHALRIRR